MDLREAQTLAKEKMAEFGLGHWGFQFDNSVRRFGCCYYRQERIQLSKKLVAVNTRERVLNTILHEIAHALAFGKYGSEGRGHGSAWKSECRVVGIDPRRCYQDQEKGGDTVCPTLKWVAVCPNGCSTPKARRSRRQGSCGPCGNGRYNPELILVYKPNPEFRG